MLVKDKLSKILQKEEFFLNEEQIDKFVYFSSLLKEWNEKMNLTALVSDEDIIYKHFLDSLLCLRVKIDWRGEKILDVGTGAGFPGIPLKIVVNDIELTLVDSLKKRIAFLENVVNKLNLLNVNCLHGRAEDLAMKSVNREAYDIVLARAVARLPVLLELCLPFVNVGGFFIALKGPEGLNELQESNHALELFGSEVFNIDECILKDVNYKRVLITFKKTFSTPIKFPRKAGIPQKRPIITNV